MRTAVQLSTDPDDLAGARTYLYDCAPAYLAGQPGEHDQRLQHSSSITLSQLRGVASKQPYEAVHPPASISSSMETSSVSTPPASDDRPAAETRPKSPLEDDERRATDEEAIAHRNAEIETSRRRFALRTANLAVRNDPSKRISELELRKLDSSLKKCTGLVRKLRGGDFAANKDALLAEARALNMTRYVSEMVAAIAESKLRVADVEAIVDICSELHQRYADVAELFVASMAQVVSAKAPADVAASATFTSPASGSARRAALRILAEMYCVGLTEDPGHVVACVKDLLRGSVVASAMDGTGEVEVALTNLSIVSSFSKGCARSFLEGHNGTSSIGAEELQSTDDFDGDWELHVVPTTVKTYLSSILTSCFNQTSQWRTSAHQSLRKAELANFQIRQARGEVSEEASANFDKAKKIFERVSTSATSLSESLGRDLPDLPEDDHTTRLLNAAESRGGAAAAAAAAAAADRQAPQFEDDEERSFYEDLPDLGHPVDSSGGTTSSPTSEDAMGESPDGPEAHVDGQGPETEQTSDTRKQTEERKSSGKQGKKGRAKGVSQPSPADVLISRIPSCSTKVSTDALAKSFAELGARGLSRRISKAMFGVQAQKVNLLPFYGRLAGTLSAALYPDLANGLTKMLDEEFRQLVSNKDIDEKLLSTRVRNAIFIGELVKFRLCPPSTFFDLLNLCLTEFTHHNVDVACHMLETCGRWLYRSPENAVRTGNMLDTIWRLKSVMNLEAKHNAMVENAYFTSKPPERASVKPRKRRDPLHEYIRWKIFGDPTRMGLDQTTRLMRKLPWSDELERYVVRKVLKTEKLRYSSLSMTAPLVVGIAKYRDSFGVAVIDGLLESIRTGLEQNDLRQSQRRIAEVKLFGELHNSRGVTLNQLFETLFMLITIGHDPEHPIEAPDPPGDFFRARLVCVLLETCSRSFERGHGKRLLSVFLPYFERYLVLKAEPVRAGGRLPREVEYMVDETFDVVRKDQRRCTSLEEAREKVASIEADRVRSASIKLPRYKVDATRNRNGAVAGHDANGRGSGGGTEDEDYSNDESDISGDDDDDGDGAGEHGEGEDDVNEEDDDDDEDTDENDDSSRTDEEEDDGDLYPKAKPIPVPRTEEEQDFERELAAMTQESIVSARSTSIPTNTRVALPVGVLRAGGGGLIAQTTERDASPGAAGVSSVSFKVLVRKGGKSQTRDLEVPVESSFVAAALEAEDSERAELQEMKRLVLGSKAVTEEESEAPGPPLPAGGLMYQNRRVTKQAREATILATLFKPKGAGGGAGGGASGPSGGGGGGGGSTGMGGPGGGPSGDVK